jgi:hypothetical protein
MHEPTWSTRSECTTRSKAPPVAPIANDGIPAPRWGEPPKILWRDRCWSAVNRALYYLSGQCLLNRRPNSGAVILTRSLWVTILVGVAALALMERLSTDATWRLALPHRDIFRDLLPWLGAIFGATYAGLYSRFASQWTYLAGLYNQLMATAIQRTAGIDQEQGKILAAWRAGFIEDAEDLHLATRPLYAAVILSLLKYPGVKDSYVQHTAGGEPRLLALEQRCREALATDEARRVTSR